MFKVCSPVGCGVRLCPHQYLRKNFQNVDGDESANTDPFSAFTFALPQAYVNFNVDRTPKRYV